MTDIRGMPVAPVGSDRAVFEAMLTIAQIPFRSEYTYQDGRAETGAVSLNIDSKGQLLPGGYSNFLTEVVFSAEGKLLAVWSWES